MIPILLLFVFATVVMLFVIFPNFMAGFTIGFMVMAWIWRELDFTIEIDEL